MRFPVDLGGVLEALGNTFAISDEVALDDVDLGAEHYSFLAPACFAVTFVNGGAGNVVATGSIDVTARATCVRCLREFDLPVYAPVDAFYVLPGHEDEIPEEQEFEVIHENCIDLYAALEQAVSVELPFAPVHDEACLGICPVCGCDRNEASCSCDDAPPASPFSVLKDLLPSDDTGEDPGDTVP
jgi:uncharacterized protein